RRRPERHLIGDAFAKRGPPCASKAPPLAWSTSRSPGPVESPGMGNTGPHRASLYKLRLRMNESARITVAIPCFNEATTVAKVVADFRAQLPEADILVCDNCSTDGTAEAARAAGARVIREKRKGKGYALQAILEAASGEACVLVDGDDTYFAEDVHALLAPVREDRADMVVGDRLK